MSDEPQPRDGCEEGYLVYEAAWYEAITTLQEVAELAESARDRIEAAKVILSYGEKFTILGAPFIPATTIEQLQSRGEDDDDSD